jgi:hypothetical protein
MAVWKKRRPWSWSPREDLSGTVSLLPREFIDTIVGFPGRDTQEHYSYCH